jgi:hypothetical protein
MEKIKEVIKFVTELYHNKFYGEIVLKFEAGIPTIGKKTETIKF